MKQLLSLVLALALTAALFTGCGCAANVSTNPNGMITEEHTRPTVMPTPTATHETTRPTETTHATMPTVTGSEPTEGNDTPGNTGSIPGTTTGRSTTPTDATQNARGRRSMPGR